MTDTPLTQLRNHFVSRRIAVPRALANAITTVDRAPEHVRPRLLAAAATITPALGPVIGSVYTDPLCPAYPNVSREIQARLALGEAPARVLRGLTPREAHAALHAGATDPAEWVITMACSAIEKSCDHAHDLSEDLCPACANSCRSLRAVSVRKVPVARWVVACSRDPERWAALEREHTVRGPHGEEIRGKLLARIDEISPADLDSGPATSVRAAFESATARAYERWTKEAATQHEPLAPTPTWFRPIRCARLLMSAAELVAEGRDLKHCVGAYAQYVRSRHIVIVSICIRARDGVHRATVEIDRSSGKTLQIKGPANAEPDHMCKLALDVCRRRWGLDEMSAP